MGDVKKPQLDNTASRNIRLAQAAAKKVTPATEQQKKATEQRGD